MDLADCNVSNVKANTCNWYVTLVLSSPDLGRNRIRYNPQKALSTTLSSTRSFMQKASYKSLSTATLWVNVWKYFALGFCYEFLLESSFLTWAISAGPSHFGHYPVIALIVREICERDLWKVDIRRSEEKFVNGIRYKK